MSSSSRSEKPARIVRDLKTGLPVIVCRRPADPPEAASPERIAEILLQQEVEWYFVSVGTPNARPTS
jgi:hypothetical protein